MDIMAEQDDIPDTAETQILSAEYKDGQLQIVEVQPFDKADLTLESESSNTLSDMETDGQTKYVELNTDEKSMMRLGLLNLTLVRCEDGTESYRLVANGESSGAAEATVTCVLASNESDGNEETSNQDAYVMMNNDQGSIVFLQSSLPETETESVTVGLEPIDGEIKKPPKISPAVILERAKALQKAKALVQNQPRKSRGRKRKSDLPSPHELLASPNFKLFLYSCKMCSFKCNAIKEMTAHKSSEHSGNKYRISGRGTTITLQCARCPYKGATHTQLMRHVQELHISEPNNKVYLNTEEVEAADVLVCGACGFESASRQLFRKHIEDEHGATTC